MAEIESGVAVALLYETRERGAHLRDALATLGTSIVYEASTHALDRAALEQSKASVVVVNLDTQTDPDLDDVYALLDDDRYRVIFNDGEVSGALSGWDQARWARHLVAKIAGDVNIDPPRPADAEAVPERVVPAVTPVEAHTDDASVVADAATTLEDEQAHVSDHPTPAAWTIDEPLPEVAPSHAEVLSFDDVASEDSAPMLDEYATLDVDPALSADAEHAFDLVSEPGEIELRSDHLSIVDFDELIDLPAEPAADAGLGLLDEFADDDTPPSAPVAKAAASEDEHFDLSEIEDLLTAFDATVSAHEPTHAETHAHDLDAALFDDPAASPQEPVKVPSAPIEFTIDFSDDAAPVAPPKAEAADKADKADTAPTVAVPTSWALEDILGDDSVATGPPPTGLADFGIEKLRAEEFLAPSTDDAATLPPEFESGLSLELIPLEEAVAPTAVESVSHETWLNPDAPMPVKAKVTRVWVLGASIGGPESVREFLGGLPRGYPALFLLAQHLGSEFVDMMIKQIGKATPLTIRAPTHGERVGHGEVVVVPSTHRLLVDAEGVVVLERNPTETAYSPSIDQVLHDVADRFGANAGAIIFSGMSSDAVEGSRYLVEKGGRVYAQTPDSCVVSTMVDGVSEAGLVGFIGSPLELAEKLVAEK